MFLWLTSLVNWISSAIMNASHTIMRLELHLARINPVVILLAVLIRNPWVQEAARIVSKSHLCEFLDWNSQSGKWRVRAILFIFAFFSFLIFKLILDAASAPGILNQNLLYAWLCFYCVVAASFWVSLWIAVAKPVADKIKAHNSIVIQTAFYSKVELAAYHFLDRCTKPDIRPPLQISDC